MVSWPGYPISIPPKGQGSGRIEEGEEAQPMSTAAYGIPHAGYSGGFDTGD